MTAIKAINHFKKKLKSRTKRKNAVFGTFFFTERKRFSLNKYFKKNEAENYVFYKVPKALFTDQKYRSVSTDAKMLYALLLDQMYLSEKNGWTDKRGRIYQYFTVKEAQEKLRFGHEKICKLFSELEKADLITRKRQGQGKPSIIYLKKFR